MKTLLPEEYRVRQFRDKDFIEDVDGAIFCVIGNIHPPDRVISYLKYVPGFRGEAVRVKWSRDGKSFSRVLPNYSALGVLKVQEYLKSICSNYVYFDPYMNIEFIAVPREKIAKHFLPELRLGEIISGARDPLEEHALRLVKTICRESNVDVGSIGITGSILLKIHNLQYSDIDLVTYGRESSVKIREAVKKLLEEESYGFHRPKGDMLKQWAEEIARIHPLRIDEAVKLYSTKWNRAIFQGRQFSIHPVNTEKEEYGRFKYIPKGIVRIRCQVVDDKDSIFLPCKYIVKNVYFLEGKWVSEIREVVSYEGLYCDIASAGETITVQGKLEEAEDLYYKQKYFRVTVGTFEARGLDYIKPDSWS
jgi:predicted nucleotidyltransferase